jgi:hypothetical protein
MFFCLLVGDGDPAETIRALTAQLGFAVNHLNPDGRGSFQRVYKGHFQNEPITIMVSQARQELILAFVIDRLNEAWMEAARAPKSKR